MNDQIMIIIRQHRRLMKKNCRIIIFYALFVIFYDLVFTEYTIIEVC